jgi:hexosaminidase
MKKTFSFLLCCCIVMHTWAQEATRKVAIIPEPASMQVSGITFPFSSKLIIATEGDAAEKTASLLNSFLQANYGFQLQDGKGSGKNVIRIKEDPSFAAEAYSLRIDQHGILLQGRAAGLFYGLQSLQQLMPLPVAGVQSFAIPGVVITDQPRFDHRGLMLDVGRYFYPVSYIKEFIDVMAHYKLNVFHWHLTEDGGWRIEIKKYPRLTDIGSKRNGTQQGHGRETFDNKPHQGFYTQEEVKEVVAYALDRHVTIMPEIEMPGHTLAALAAYPSLSCTGGPFQVPDYWGIREEIFCAGNDSTFHFLEDVLTEVIALFPGKYIHIGGDEAPKALWKKCPKCQARIKAEGLKDEHELQSYFIRRIEKFVSSKGRKIIGWDEILEGGLAANAAVMSWRGEEGGIEAARLKHEVVMTPTSFLYLDYYQGNPETEPVNIGGYLPLSMVYGYEPVPKVLTAAERGFIKGLQGNVWSEFIHDEDKVNYMTYPRALAVAEIGWSPLAKKNYSVFLNKLKERLAWLDKMGVGFRIPEPAGLEDRIIIDQDLKISLTSPVTGATIFYTLDGSIPDANSKVFNGPLSLSLKDKETKVLTCVVQLTSGRKSAAYTATYKRKKYQEAVALKPTGSGLDFSVAYKRFELAKDVVAAVKDSSGVILDMDLNIIKKRQRTFGAIYEGYIKAEVDGIYEFTNNSDDGTVLYVGDELLIDNDGEHGAGNIHRALLPLRKGYHPIKVLYFNAGGHAELNVGMKVQGSAKELPMPFFR